MGAGTDIDTRGGCPAFSCSSSEASALRCAVRDRDCRRKLLSSPSPSAPPPSPAGPATLSSKSNDEYSTLGWAAGRACCRRRIMRRRACTDITRDARKHGAHEAPRRVQACKHLLTRRCCRKCSVGRGAEGQHSPSTKPPQRANAKKAKSRSENKWVVGGCGRPVGGRRAADGRGAANTLPLPAWRSAPARP